MSKGLRIAIEVLIKDLDKLCEESYRLNEMEEFNKLNNVYRLLRIFYKENCKEES